MTSTNHNPRLTINEINMILDQSSQLRAKVLSELTVSLLVGARKKMRALIRLYSVELPKPKLVLFPQSPAS